MKQLDYNYFNVPIGGGGYVTGIEFDKSDSSLLYIRTDIGGLYRFDRASQTWKSLIDFVTEDDLSETYPAAVCSENGVLYSVCGYGNSETSKLCISHDFGETFEYKSVPAKIHGNFNGRGTGRRLAVKNGVIYLASFYDGILKSADNGESWEKFFPNGEKCIAFIDVSDDGKRVIASTAGMQNMPDENMRGHSLYVSYDGMQSFEKLTQPESVQYENIPLSGLVGHRIATDGDYFYITMNCSGYAKWNPPLSYSCDSGSVNGGYVLRYKIGDDGRLGDFEDITPEKDNRCGYGGITTEQGILLTATFYRPDERIYMSRDCGATWKPVLDGKKGIHYNTPYMKMENNENHSLIHWMSDVKINPHDINEAWFNTGTGVFRTVNLCDESPLFEDCCDGIEETVHLNVYSPHSGDIEVIDILGDLGGFAFEDIHRQAKNTFTDENNLRYITCINADYPDNNPSLVAVTARGNWVGSTKGGLIISHDGGVTFDTRPALPYGLSDKLDEVFHRIETPNVNAGWCAVSADGKGFVWCVADRGNILPSDCVVYSLDECRSYGVSEFIGESGKYSGNIKVFSDRLIPTRFYAFGSLGEFFVSNNGGKTFRQVKTALPQVDYGRIDGNNANDIKPDHGKSGVFYITGLGGLYKLCYDGGKCDVKRLISENDRVKRVGLGIKGESFLQDDKMIYVNGWFDGVYGFYRSEDDGKSWIRINTDRQMFGQINAITGDSRVHGRFFLATGSRGLICGEPL